MKIQNCGRNKCHNGLSSLVNETLTIVSWAYFDAFYDGDVVFFPKTTIPEISDENQISWVLVGLRKKKTTISIKKSIQIFPEKDNQCL